MKQCDRSACCIAAMYAYAMPSSVLVTIQHISSDGAPPPPPDQEKRQLRLAWSSFSPSLFLFSPSLFLFISLCMCVYRLKRSLNTHASWMHLGQNHPVCFAELQRLREKSCHPPTPQPPNPHIPPPKQNGSASLCLFATVRLLCL